MRSIIKVKGEEKKEKNSGLQVKGENTDCWWRTADYKWRREKTDYRWKGKRHTDYRWKGQRQTHRLQEKRPKYRLQVKEPKADRQITAERDEDRPATDKRAKVRHRWKGKKQTNKLIIIIDVGEWCRELRESRLEAWMKSHKSEVAIT